MSRARRGRKVERDVWRAAPSLAVLGRTSLLFSRLPTDRRGMVAAVVLAVVAALAVGAGVLVLLT